MVIIKLQGGLGNQMFQYAAARSFSRNRKTIYLDFGFLQRNNKNVKDFTARCFELHIFNNLKADKANFFQLSLFKSSWRVYSLLRRILKSTLVIIQQNTTELIDFQLYEKAKFLYLDGYFQSENYFNKVKDEIQQEFSFPVLDSTNEMLRSRISQEKNSVSIHFRRGDYVNSGKALRFHGVLPITYYVQALNILVSKYTNLSLFIFSDDLTWAKKAFTDRGIPTYFIGNNDGADSWKDMALMASCKHHIIANSSFSWWGAWLSPRNGEVFAPANWFNPKIVKFKITDIIPDHWTILTYE